MFLHDYSHLFFVPQEFSFNAALWKKQIYLTCFNLKLFRCNDLPPGRLALVSFIPSTISVCFGAGIKTLGLCRGLCEANSVGGLVKEEREKRLGEEHRDRGFEGQQRARGLGEEQTELCFGEGEWVRCFGELEKMGLGEDVEGKGEASLWDCTAARGLLLAANPVAWMTLICCWPSSSAVLELWRNSAVDCGAPAGWEEDWRR